jgi:hypothetical protein
MVERSRTKSRLWRGFAAALDETVFLQNHSFTVRSAQPRL